MGWRDAQAKVDAGAYKPKKDPFGELATGFANVFVPTYTKIQEEKRAEERKKREDEAKRAAAAAAASRAANKAEKKRQEQTDYVLMHLGFTDPNTAPPGVRTQVLAGVTNEGVSGLIANLEKRFPDGYPGVGVTETTTPPSLDAQTNEAFTSTPKEVGTHVTANFMPAPTEGGTVTTDASTTTDASGTAVKPDVENVGTSTVDATDQETVNLFGPIPKEVDLNAFIGQSSTDIADWIKFNKDKYKPEELVELEAYLVVTKSREEDALWWKDPQKLDDMSTIGIGIAMNGLDPESEEYKSLDFALGRKNGVVFDSLMDADVDEFARFKVVYGEQMAQQGNLEMFDDLYELAKIKEKNGLWWQDPREVDNLSDNGLQFAIDSAKAKGATEEVAELQRAQKSRTEGLDLNTLRGKSVVEFDQYLEQYRERLINEGIMETFEVMRSLQKAKEDGVTSDKVINAKDVFLRSRMGGTDYQEASAVDRGQMMISFEREWSEGTRIADNDTYTQANYDADFIEYSEIIREVGLGNGANYSEEQITEARRWMTVTKPIAEERLTAGTNAALNNRIDMLVNDLSVDPEMAKKIALGVIESRVDPITRETYNYDLSTGTRIGTSTSLPKLAVIPDENIETLFTEVDALAERISEINVNKPMGLAGALRRTANTATTFLGLPKPSKETSEAQGIFGMLAVLTETTLSAALPENRDSVYLKKRLETLAPQYGIGKSAEDVSEATLNMITFLQGNLNDMRYIATGDAGVQPADVSKARIGIPRVERLLGYYEALSAAVANADEVPTSGGNYLGNTSEAPVAAAVVEENPTSTPEQDTLKQGTKENPYVVGPETDPATIPSEAYFTDPNGVLRQKR
jgi:hypothetical protein